MGEVVRWWCCGWQRLLFDVPARARLSGLPTTLDAGKSLVSTVFPDPEFRRPYYFWDEIIVVVILFTFHDLGCTIKQSRTIKIWMSELTH